MTNQSQRKKLCWNCEGAVTFTEETCPYCGVSVVPAFLEGAGADFAPPYSKTEEKDLEVPKSPYGESLSEEKRSVLSLAKDDEEEPQSDEFKSIMMAVALLLSGSVFFLFSLALALFSQNGILTLQWDGSVWYIYLTAAIPLILLGWKSLMKVN